MLAVWTCAGAFGAFSKEILPVEISEGISEGQNYDGVEKNIFKKLGQKESIISSFKIILKII